MARIVLFNKPFNVLTQFRTDDERVTLAHFIHDKQLRVAGRLDYDSEGLLLLTDSGKINSTITNPKFKHSKTYWAQIEGAPSDADLVPLRQGLMLKDGMTRPAKVRIVSEPDRLWARTPPIRQRATIPTTWLEIQISEGRNRQVRRMTAAIGYPTLRLVRHNIAQFNLDDLQPGESRILEQSSHPDLFASFLLETSPLSRSFKGDIRLDKSAPRKSRRNTRPIDPFGK